MGKAYDVEAFRKKKIKKKRYRKFLTGFLIVILVVAAGLLVKEWMDSEAAQKEEVAEFPINLKGESPISLKTTEDSLVVTTEGVVNFYSKLAQRQNSVVHGFSKPVTQTAGKYALTYDHGGYTLRLDTKNGTAKTLKLKNSILFAQVQEDGMVAVAYADSSYTSGLSVYNSNLDEPVCTYYMNEYIMALDFSSKESCVIAAQTTNGSSFASVVYKIFFNQEKEVFKKEYQTSMIVSLSVKDDGVIALACEQEILMLNREGEKLGSYSYPGTLSLLDQSQKDKVVVGVINATDPNATDLVCVDLDGKQAASVTTSERAVGLTCTDNRIYAMTKSDVLVYSEELEKLDSYQNKNESKYLAVLNGQIFGLSDDRLEELS